MNTLYLLIETYTNGYRIEILDILSLSAVMSGILVITSNNPIVSVLFLIGLFLSIACYLIMLGFNFIGLSYLLVYVGAISILFLFILMLINVRISELLSNTSNSIPLTILISILFIYSVSETLPVVALKNFFFNLGNTFIGLCNNIFKLDMNFISVIDTNKIYYVSSKTWDGNLWEANHITSIGNIIYTSHSIWLILTSIILLLAMVGAIVITIKPKKI